MKKTGARRFLMILTAACFLVCMGVSHLLAQGSAVTDWENDFA